MARIANTFVQSSSIVNREELADVVSRITPEDTPIYSMIRKGRCNSVHPEWPVDDLAPPDDNFQAEGDEYSFAAITPAKRPGNYCQIFRKDFIISGTQQSVSNAGNVEKIRYQSLKKGVEIRKDVEYALVYPTASTSTDPRKLGSIPTWLETNTNRATGGADGGYKAADGFTDTPTDAADGNIRAFSKALLDTTMQSCYQEGGNVKNVVLSPYVKSVFVGFMSDSNVASFRYQASDGMNNSIVATADIYEGPFGKVRVVPNRVMAAGSSANKRKATSRNAFLIDPSMMEFKWLRKIARDPKVAKTGDAMKYVILGEGTLCVNNEKAHGVIADITGL